MTTTQAIFTIFEILLIVGLFTGFIFEYKLIDFENKIKAYFKKILEVIR